MRTTYPIALVLAMMLTAAFFSGSGFNGIVDGEQRTDALDEQVEQAKDNGSFEDNELKSGQGGTDDGTIVGFIVDGTNRIFAFAGMVAVLPITLQSLGFPQWFALPIGSLFTIVVSIGVLQFVTGRMYS